MSKLTDVDEWYYVRCQYCDRPSILAYDLKEFIAICESCRRYTRRDEIDLLPIGKTPVEGKVQ